MHYIIIGILLGIGLMLAPYVFVAVPPLVLVAAIAIRKVGIPVLVIAIAIFVVREDINEFNQGVADRAEAAYLAAHPCAGPLLRPDRPKDCPWPPPQ